MPDLNLDAYDRKRDFSRTAEPRATTGHDEGRRFVVQKHDATRLHYDVRLELDGVLLSWAVPRGPSLDPAERRLAVRTEDHPVSYAGFEGTIPAGSYGAGTVMLWDCGTWAPEGDPRDGLRAGKLRFALHGVRMRGDWMLIRMRGSRREIWLLRKRDDAETGEADALTRAHRTSVETGRSMEEIAGRASHPRSASSRAPGDGRRSEAAAASLTRYRIRAGSPNREPYPEAGIRRRGRIGFCERVVGAMLAHLAGRSPAPVRSAFDMLRCNIDFWRPPLDARFD